MKRIIKVPESSFSVTADVFGLYPSITHKEGNLALWPKLEEQNSWKTHTDDLANVTKFVLKNNFFEFRKEVKQQIHGAVVGLKFSSPYACIHMDKTETDFLKK